MTPPSIKTTRSATSRAKPISCVTTTMVMPPRASSRMTELGVEGGGRLVKEHHVRVHGERPRDGDALLLAAGELTWPIVGAIGQAYTLELIKRHALRLLTAAFEYMYLREHHILFCREMGKEVELLKNHPHAFAQSTYIASRVSNHGTLEPNAPVRRILETIKTPEQRRLA